MQSEANATGRSMALLNGSIKGRRESAGSKPCSGRPKCDITTTRAPLSASSRIVGASRSMRIVSVTAPFLTGTLRSARSSTRFEPTSMSSRVRKLGMPLGKLCVARWNPGNAGNLDAVLEQRLAFRWSRFTVDAARLGFAAMNSARLGGKLLAHILAIALNVAAQNLQRATNLGWRWRRLAGLGQCWN